MITTTEQAKASLTHIAELLDKPLSEALMNFIPDMHIRDITDKYAKGWEGKTLHEFMVGVIASGDPGEPDVWNADMEPFSLFLLLDVLYRQGHPAHA